MRPKIISCRHISRSVHYNEEKIVQHRAERLTAANMLKPLEQLSREDIQRRFERRMKLNERVDTSLHITLNFDPQDQLTNDRMREIAHSYMHEIGFVRQPWIAWRHNDAGHPHCHIVTTHVQWNGDPIDLYNIGQNQSERARLKIERDFQLVTTEMKQQQRERERQMHDPEAPHRLVYGQEPLTRALSKIVDYVAEKYHYTSIEELNAALRLYNVEAYIGQPGTKLYDSHGLLYRALDGDGHYIGRPLKASFFDSKPTLDNLEKKFAQNHSEKLEHKEHVEVFAMYYLLGKPDNIAKLHKELNSEGIVLQIDRDRAGTVKQVTYVDVRNKVIIPGKELRPECNAEAIQHVLERHRVRLAFEESPEYKQRQTLRQGPRLRIG